MRTLQKTLIRRNKTKTPLKSHLNLFFFLNLVLYFSYYWYSLIQAFRKNLNSSKFLCRLNLLQLCLNTKLDLFLPVKEKKQHAPTPPILILQLTDWITPNSQNSCTTSAIFFSAGFVLMKKYCYLFTIFKFHCFHFRCSIACQNCFCLFLTYDYTFAIFSGSFQ